MVIAVVKNLKYVFKQSDDLLNHYEFTLGSHISLCERSGACHSNLIIIIRQMPLRSDLVVSSPVPVSAKNQFVRGLHRAQWASSVDRNQQINMFNRSINHLMAGTDPPSPVHHV